MRLGDASAVSEQAQHEMRYDSSEEEKVHWSMCALEIELWPDALPPIAAWLLISFMYPEVNEFLLKFNAFLW